VGAASLASVAAVLAFGRAAIILGVEVAHGGGGGDSASRAGSDPGGEGRWVG
jgi:hypothetical protein